jgi:hypothetical protein
MGLRGLPLPAWPVEAREAFLEQSGKFLSDGMTLSDADAEARKMVIADWEDGRL